MSQQSGFSPNIAPNTPPSNPSPSNPPRLSWNETWIMALTRPSLDTYEQIADDTPPQGNSKAYTWIFIAAMISALITVIASLVFPARLNVRGVNSSAISSSFSLLSVICVPVQGALSVLFFAIYIGITQGIAGALGGTGTYSKLLYVSAAFSAPLTIISAVLGVIPFVNLLSIPLGLYALVVDLMIVRAVNQFGWGKAILSSFLIWILVVVLVAVVVIVILALLGPSIGTVFSNIVRTL